MRLRDVGIALIAFAAGAGAGVASGAFLLADDDARPPASPGPAADTVVGRLYPVVLDPRVTLLELPQSTVTSLAPGGDHVLVAASDVDGNTKLFRLRVGRLPEQVVELGPVRVTALAAGDGVVFAAGENTVIAVVGDRVVSTVSSARPGTALDMVSFDGKLFVARDGERIVEILRWDGRTLAGDRPTIVPEGFAHPAFLAAVGGGKLLVGNGGGSGTGRRFTGILDTASGAYTDFAGLLHSAVGDLVNGWAFGVPVDFREVATLKSTVNSLGIHGGIEIRVSDGPNLVEATADGEHLWVWPGGSETVVYARYGAVVTSVTLPRRSRLDGDPAVVTNGRPIARLDWPGPVEAIAVMDDGHAVLSLGKGILAILDPRHDGPR